MTTSPPAWVGKVPCTDVFCVLDDALDPVAAHDLFGSSLIAPPRLGTVSNACRTFGQACWLTAATGEGLLASGEVATPALVRRPGARARVSLVQLSASGWSRFTMAEPGFRLERIAFVADDGCTGTCVARFSHATEAAARVEHGGEGGRDCWCCSLWEGPLWCQPSTLNHLQGSLGDNPDYGAALAAERERLREHATAPWPALVAYRCDGCPAEFTGTTAQEAACAWQAHIESGECPGDTEYCPTERLLPRPPTLRIPEGVACYPAPGVLRRMLGAALRVGGDALLASMLDETMLADGSTTLRAHLERVPTLKAYVLGGPAARQAAEVSEDLPFTRHHCCPMLRPSGELAVKYDGSVREGHKVRRDLLLMGFSIADVSACRAAGCVTLDSCCDWLSERTRATWSEWAHLSVAGEPTASVAVAYDMSADLHHPSTDGRVATSTVEALEGPQRVHGTLEVLARSGLLAACRVLRNSGRVATREELERVHEPSHVDLVLRGDAADSSPEAAAEARRALLRSCGVRGEQTADGDREDVYIGPHTMRAARSAAGVAIDLVERIVRNEIRAGVSVMRPAGHHAGRASIGGGCFVNSVAAAASTARVSGVERVLIVDLDVHHGDGTQEIFYADPSVLTISIHSIEHLPGAYYPPAGLPAHVGSGDARGRNVNVAFTYADGGYGDADYALAFELLVLPIARAFEPQLVIVAAGYDSVRGDPLGGFDLTAQGYAHLIAQLSQLARGKMLVSLEGGYSVTAQAGAMHECVRTLLAGGGAPGASLGAASAATTTAAPPSSPPKDAAAQCIAAALRCQAPHWVCLAGWEAKLAIGGCGLGTLETLQGLRCETHSPCWCGIGGAESLD